MASTDGSVRLEVDISTNKAEKKLTDLKKEISNYANELNKEIGKKDVISKQIEDVSKNLDVATKKAETFKQEMNGVDWNTGDGSIAGQLEKATKEQKRLMEVAQASSDEYIKATYASSESYGRDLVVLENFMNQSPALLKEMETKLKYSEQMLGKATIQANNAMTSGDSDAIIKAAQEQEKWAEHVRIANEQYEETKKKIADAAKQIDELKPKLEEETAKLEELEAKRNKALSDYEASARYVKSLEEIEAMTSEVQKLNSEYAETEERVKSINKSLESSEREYGTLEKQASAQRRSTESSAEINKAKATLENSVNNVKRAADGGFTIRLNVKNAEKELDGLAKKITNLQKQIESETTNKDSIAERYAKAAAELDSITDQVNYIKKSLKDSSTHENEELLKEELADAVETQRAWTKEVNKLDSAYDRSKNKINSATDALHNAQNEYSALENAISGNGQFLGLNDQIRAAMSSLKSYISPSRIMSAIKPALKAVKNAIEKSIRGIYKKLYRYVFRKP